MSPPVIGGNTRIWCLRVWSPYMPLWGTPMNGGSTLEFTAVPVKIEMRNGARG